jgi:hypothetical protein
MTDSRLDQRLAALESRLGRLEIMIGVLTDKVDHAAGADLDQAKAGLQAWVTDYVSLRLQQLVPETCEHDGRAEEASTGPVLPGTRIRCTDEVLHRLGRIPIPFVRQMVTDKVVETARAEKVTLVDVDFFERTATF